MIHTTRLIIRQGSCRFGDAVAKPMRNSGITIVPSDALNLAPEITRVARNVMASKKSSGASLRIPFARTSQRKAASGRVVRAMTLIFPATVSKKGTPNRFATVPSTNSARIRKGVWGPVSRRESRKFLQLAKCMIAILPVAIDKSPAIPTSIAVAIAESGTSLPWSNALGDFRSGPKMARP